MCLLHQLLVYICHERGDIGNLLCLLAALARALVRLHCNAKAETPSTICGGVSQDRIFGYAVMTTKAYRS